MEYEIIERNEYGVLVREKSIFNCRKCKYSGDKEHSCLKRCDSDMYGYYLTDQEAAKLETEITPETFTINDMYVESKLLFDCQDELKSLQIENDQLKERIKELESDKSTELDVFIPVEINHYKGESTYIYRKSFRTIEECQHFFDDMHKKDSGERWGTMLCDYREAKWETKENGDLCMGVGHDGAFVKYICMNCGRKIIKK